MVMGFEGDVFQIKHACPDFRFPDVGISGYGH